MLILKPGILHLHKFTVLFSSLHFIDLPWCFSDQQAILAQMETKGLDCSADKFLEWH